MPKQSPKALAIRICKAVYEMKGARLHWVGVRDLCEHMKLRRTDALDEALEYAHKQGFLTCSPAPIHSVMLARKGEMAARGKVRRK